MFHQIRSDNPSDLIFVLAFTLREAYWHSDRAYQPIDPNAQGWVWCQALGLWLGTWEGKVEDDTAIWLRFYDQAGNLVLLPEEAEQQRADSEQQRADRLAQRLRELGEDPDAI